MTSAHPTDGRSVAPAGGDDMPVSDPASVRLAALALMSLLTLTVVALDWESPIRTALTLVFALFVPGLALGELLGIRDPAQLLALATAASLAVETLVAVGLLYAGLFSALAAIAIVVGLTLLAVAASVLRRDRAAPPAPGGTSIGAAA